MDEFVHVGAVGFAGAGEVADGFESDADLEAVSAEVGHGVLVEREVAAQLVVEQPEVMDD